VPKNLRSQKDAFPLTAFLSRLKGPADIRGRDEKYSDLNSNDHIQFSHLRFGILENSLMLFEIIVRSRLKA
jgi:hypothetical protein